MFNFGKPNYFLKGMVETIMRDPQTGNIVYYDNIASTAALNYTFNLQEIVGGFGNKLAGLLPDTTRLSGTYTSQGFSLDIKGLQVGSEVEYNAPIPVCEVITAEGTTLKVTGNPVYGYGQSKSSSAPWALVRVHGAKEYDGTNYGINPETKEVIGFTATAGLEYDVLYNATSASAQMLVLPDAANPAVVSITQKWGVYATQNNSVSKGTLQGFLYVVIPTAVLGGDAGINGSQTENATTEFTWQAISSADNKLACSSCENAASDLAYYVYAPCDSAVVEVEQLAILGNGVSVEIGESQQIPVKYVMPNGSLVQPDFSDLTFNSAEQSVATVDAQGVVKGVTQGDTIVLISLVKSNGTTLQASCRVSVESN